MKNRDRCYRLNRGKIIARIIYSSKNLEFSRERQAVLAFTRDWVFINIRMNRMYY